MERDKRDGDGMGGCLGAAFAGVIASYMIISGN
jgi:hypothetical protein